MAPPAIDLTPLVREVARLREACSFSVGQPDDSPLEPHLRSAVVQPFEFTYELSVRMLRRALIERSASADRIADLSFADLLRRGADAGLIGDPSAWQVWRQMRNATSHAYDAAKAEAVAARAPAFADDAAALLLVLEASLARS